MTYPPLKDKRKVDEYMVKWKDNGKNCYTWETSTRVVRAKTAQEAVDKLKTTAYKWELIDVKKI